MPGLVSSRVRILAGLIVVPAVLGAILLAVVGVTDVVQPTSLDNRSPDGSLVDSIMGDDVETAYAFIRAGQDPNATIPVDDAEVTGGRQVMASPLMLAVAKRRENIVGMLLSFGARADLPQNTSALCLAKQIHADGVADMLTELGGKGWDTHCPARTDASAPLLEYVD